MRLLLPNHYHPPPINSSDLHLDCGTLEYAGIVRRSLSVEPELRPTMITRTMTSDQNGTLHMYPCEKRDEQHRLLWRGMEGVRNVFRLLSDPFPLSSSTYHIGLFPPSPLYLIHCIVILRQLISSHYEPR